MPAACPGNLARPRRQAPQSGVVGGQQGGFNPCAQGARAACVGGWCIARLKRVPLAAGLRTFCSCGIQAGAPPAQMWSWKDPSLSRHAIKKDFSNRAASQGVHAFVCLTSQWTMQEGGDWPSNNRGLRPTRRNSRNGCWSNGGSRAQKGLLGLKPTQGCFRCLIGLHAAAAARQVRRALAGAGGPTARACALTSRGGRQSTAWPSWRFGLCISGIVWLFELGNLWCCCARPPRGVPPVLAPSSARPQFAPLVFAAYQG